MSPRETDDLEGRVEPEGREAFEEEASGGSLAPSQELEEALREAAEAVETPAAGAPRGGRPAAGAETPGAPGAPGGPGELEELKDRHLRLMADFENHRRRALRDREEAFRYGHENLVKDLLGTVDNLDRAIEHAQQSEGGDFQSMLQGVELVRRELHAALAKHGVDVIDAQGEAFDPNIHEAMAQEQDESVPTNTVVRVLQTGYRLRDRLLRPARVMVSKRSEGTTGAKGANGTGEKQGDQDPS